MPLSGAGKRAYDRLWERCRRRVRSGDRHISPAKVGRFVSFDGEGLDGPDGAHRYVLLQDSSGASIANPNGLSTSECLRFISEVHRRFGGRVCSVSFAFDYDVNNIIKDLPREKLERLWKTGEVFWGCWRLEWRPRKWFQVSLLERDTNRPIRRASVRIYDIFGFFQCGFVPACEEWLGKKEPDLRIVRKGKRLRRGFGLEALPFMREYNAAELRLMVNLVKALKRAFDAAGIPLSQFYGAGAAATAFLTQIDAKRFIDRLQPSGVEDGARHGYFGGRVEVPLYGKIPGKIYDFDVNSAYADAMANLPNLRAGRWERGKTFRPDLPFSIYHLSWKLQNGRRFYPLPWRSPEGAIYFPPTGRAWIWHPELGAALECGGFTKGSVRILSAWHFIPDDPSEKPFAKLREMYDLRRKLKDEGNPAQKALKLLLASVTGKLAQSVTAAGKFGASDGHARKPTYHQIEYAGYITSVTRAKLYRAACQKPEAILAFATDGLLCREPLDVPISDQLGGWKVKTYRAATIVQSGVYRLLRADGKWEAFGRGFADKQLPWGRIERAWRQGKRSLTVRSRNRFIGLGAAIQGDNWDLWRRFLPIPREIALAAVGKRIDLHLPRTWTTEDNPTTRPHETEPYDIVTLERYDPESTPWRPKWEDPGSGTVEDWELTFETRSHSLHVHHAC